MDADLTFKEVSDFIKRRMGLLVAIFVVVMLLTAIITVALPPIYKSEAVITIEEQQIPDEFVKSTITTYAANRLETITSQIMSYSALKSIIRKFHLYPEYTDSGKIDKAVRTMKKAIKIEHISAKAGTRSATIAFILSYEGKDPQKVMQVTKELASLYLLKEAKSREKQVKTTTTFLENELNGLRAKMNEYEKKISVFKQQHLGELPGNTTTLLQIISRLQTEYDRITSRIRSLEDRKIYLKGQLANIEPLKPVVTDKNKLAANPKERIKALRLELIRMKSRFSEKHPDVRKLVAEIAELESQIGKADEAVVKIKQLKQARTELSALKARLGPSHPDVIEKSKEVELLSKEVDTMITDRAMLEVSERKPDNPLYVNLMTQVVMADAEINNLRQDLHKINNDLADYQKKLENAPIVEKELNNMLIDYENAKRRYNDIANKLLQARIAQEMEEQQQGEHFTITDPPYLPKSPYKPNRIAVFLLGFVLASGLSLGTVAVIEAMDHTVKNTEELKDVTGIDVLTALPYMKTPEEKRALLIKRAMITVGAVCFFALVLVAVDKLVVPLEDIYALIYKRLLS